MSVLKVVRSGNPVLRQSAQPVDLEELKNPEPNELQNFIDDMVDTMKHEEGVGLAATQVGRSLRIVTLECATNSRYPDRPEFSLMVLVNPKITRYSEEKFSGWEACLSLPGLRGLVSRSEEVVVEAYDRLGEKTTIEADGFLAIVLQHEIDHLDGVLYIDRMTDMSKLCFEEEFQEFWVDEDEEQPATTSREGH